MSDNLSWLQQNKKMAMAIGAAAAGALAVTYMYKTVMTPRGGEKADTPTDETPRIETPTGAAASSKAQGSSGLEESKGPSASADVPATLVDSNFTTPNIQLYSEEATMRDNLLDNVAYTLLLTLSDKIEEGYKGSYSVSFDLKEIPATKVPLFLDFQGKQVSKVTINGTRSAKVSFDRHRIQLPWELLKQTGNVVSLTFENSYVSNSAGLHFYKDPQDGKVYIYSHLEPFFCHRFFPCFDQPSIRSSLKLTVVVPHESWWLIANGTEQTVRLPVAETGKVAEVLASAGFGPESLTEMLGQEAKTGGFLWDFAVSPKISSYIYGLCAGEYHKIDYIGETESDTEPIVPMRIFCRTSKLANLDAKEQYRQVTAGIKYYQDLFSTPFPWSKYDQVYVPEFRIRGMENVGVICLTDRVLVDQATITEEQKLLHRRVTVHELAHMWFGDLITMQWWNDLWLKESFADFCACCCMSECPGMADIYTADRIHVPLVFTERALDADLKPTTHPIQVPIRHTGDGENAFDMISYCKGASWIKVMDNFVGRNTIKLGMKKYFDRYSHKNTVLTDLVNCLNEAMREVRDADSQIDLIKWTDSWLKTQGPNTLLVERDAEKKLSIRQGFGNEYASHVYREQCVDVLVYDSLNVSKSLLLENVKIAASEVTADIVAQMKPEVQAKYKTLFQTVSTDNNDDEDEGKGTVVAMVNANCKGYCRALLDQESIDFFLEHLSEIDSANRCYLWRILFDHVRLQKVSPMEYITAVQTHLLNESEGQIVDFILHNVCWIVDHGLVDNGSDAKFTEYATTMALELLSSTLIDKIRNLPEAKQSEKTLLVDYLIRLLPSQSNFEWLRSIAESQRVEYEAKLVAPVNKLQRYACLRKCAAVVSSAQEADQIKALMDQEKTRDYSDLDEIEHVKYRGAIPLESSKTQILEEMITGKLPQQSLIHITVSFYNGSNPAQSQMIADKWLANIERVESEQHRDYFLTYFTELSPRHLKDPKHLEGLKAILARNIANDDKALLVKLLKEEIAQMELIKAIVQSQVSKVNQGLA